VQPEPPAGPVVVFSDPATLAHEPSAGHPENAERMKAVEPVIASLLAQRLVVAGSTRPATEEDLLLAHSAAYVKLVRAEIDGGRRTLSTGDTELSRGSLRAALAATGTVLAAVDAVMRGPMHRSFCAIRPPGHHASSDRGMGFCLFNNIAIGARHAQRAHGVERVLIADWDVHHGNGTQAIFDADGSVLFFDTHQHPWYPGTGLRDEVGAGRGRGLIMNRPFPAGSGRQQILTAFLEELVPAAERFKPQLVMISAGFDSRAADPLGEFTLQDEDFADLTRVVVDIARAHAGGRIVSVLEGGYSLSGLALAVGAHVTALAEEGRSVA
jgi:acetoin utilization deacetylase AcuC-like enzyme